MSLRTRRTRAYRPSAIGPGNDNEEEKELDKAENVVRMARRAAAGMPLFEAVKPLERTKIGGYE